jgi:hypothetical protein
MPVTATTNKVSYSCDGSLQVFTFSFPINAESEIQVRIRDAAGDETLLTLTTDYTLSKASDSWDSGGYVTTVATYAAGNEIHIRRVVTADQQTDYVENDAFSAESHEAAIDKLTMLIQQLDEMIERAILLKATTGYSDLYIPDPVANRFLAWRSDLAGLKNVAALTATGTYTITAFAETLFDDVDAAAFLTTLGLDTDLLTLSLPASVTISAFIKTLLDDADAAAARTTLDVIQDIANVITSSLLNMGQGLVDNSDAVDVDGIVEQGAGANELKCKVVEIGDWNMDADDTKNVAHGLTVGNIRMIQVIIRNDGGTSLSPLNYKSADYDYAEGRFYADATNVLMGRRATGNFDGVAFDSTSYNRGWITIWYEA